MDDPTTYVLRDPGGNSHVVTLPGDQAIEIPVGWTYLPNAAPEAIWSESAAAEERYLAKVNEVTTTQTLSETTAEARHATVAAVEARYGLAPGTLTTVLPPVPHPDDGEVQVIGETTP